ncbi:MAG: MurR/RpiR family transcriptional regulator [Methylobacteriaceae bacterium]|jgi:DNA-binding MurR/RpiR family transcriptional regulator|nr:MurR/RpiR family transcriptional regulator [Methylobacteriaceae bacterium]
MEVAFVPVETSMLPSLYESYKSISEILQHMLQSVQNCFICFLMKQSLLNEQITGSFGGMSNQLKIAARFVLDHPHDVALLSMREQAHHAGVHPSTMTRLAKYLGFDGYESIRTRYAEALREGEISFAEKAGRQAIHQQARGDGALAVEMFRSIAAQIVSLTGENSLRRVEAAASRLSSALHVYCLGLRSSHTAAWHMGYILRLIGEKSSLLDDSAGLGADAIGRAGPDDVLFVVSVNPYTRRTVELTEYAHSRHIPVVAVTDSEVSPIARLAEISVLVATESPSFFHSLSPAFAAAEVISALVAGHGSDEAQRNLHQFDEQLKAFDTYFTLRTPKRNP